MRLTRLRHGEAAAAVKAWLNLVSRQYAHPARWCKASSPWLAINRLKGWGYPRPESSMLLDGLRPSDQGPLRGTTPGVFASAGAGWRCGGGGVGLGGGRDLAIPSRHVRQLCEWGHHQP